MKVIQAVVSPEKHRRMRQMSVDTGDSMRTLVGVATDYLLEAHERKEYHVLVSNNVHQEQEQEQEQDQ